MFASKIVCRFAFVLRDFAKFCITFCRNLIEKPGPFKQRGTNTESASYENALKEVEIVKDINCHSKFPNGTLDIIFPKDGTEETPIIFWTHVGGFIAGYKSGLTGYAVELASRGYTLVNINFAVAPSHKYPAPVLQLGEAYKYIKDNEEKYKLKLNNVNFAGDSAGARNNWSIR